MNLSKEEIKIIERALSLRGIKDTQFDYAQFPLSMSELIPIVLHGRNKLLDIGSLANSVLLHKDSHFINVSFTEEGKIAPYYLEDAISTIPLENRRLGLVITFFDKETKLWVVYQFKGQDINSFQDATQWLKLLPEHFKGLFLSQDSLFNIVPKPDIGDYAYVRQDNPEGYYLYLCNESHVWENMGELAKLIADIELDGNISISNLNTWVIDGTDTGISIYPRKIYWEQITDRPITWEDLDDMISGNHIFSLKDHTHTIEDFPGLKEIIEDYKEELENKAEKEHNHDERYSKINHEHDSRYAKYDIDTAVRNMMDSKGNPLFNPEGIVIPRTTEGGGGGGGSWDVDIIQTGDNIPPTNDNIFSSLKSIMTFLRKDVPDSTNHRIGFNDGITIGDFINSITQGRGARIDKDGNIQAQSAEIRGYLKVLELVYNRLSAIEGDLVFTESGVVEEIINQDQGEYTLLMRKRWDGDFILFEKDDVLRGIVNNLSSINEYHTAWMRVVDVDRAANQIKVVHYSSAETPDKSNHEVTEKMVLHRYGNATNKDRQSSWHISTTEGRISFLTGVTKPILEDYNYASFWGLPAPLKIFEGKPINYKHPYAYMRGLMVLDLIRVDYNGNPIKTVINKGEWKEGETYNDGSKSPYILHDVYHNGVIWRCIIDEATQEPKFNSTLWAVISDNTRFSLELFTEAPLFYRPNTEFSYDLRALVFHGTEDITQSIRDIDWRWERKTGDTFQDNNWNILHANSTDSISITEKDMGTPKSGVTIFKCEVYIKDGDTKYKLQKNIKL